MATVATWNKGAAPAGTNGWNLTPDVRTALESMNVVVPVANQTERDALAPPLGKYVGMAVTRADRAGAIEVWDGAAWRQLSYTFSEYANSAFLNQVVAAGGQAGPFYQNFPAGRFTVAPIITFAGSNARHGFSAANVTADGFDLYIRNDTSVDTVTGATIYYVAKQMTPTTAAG